MPADEAPPPVVTDDPLISRGYHVTTGAAAGYVDDRLCGSCHVDLFRSYQQVGMARSFYRPRPEKLIEDFDSGGFFHEPSRRHYRMVRRDGQLFLRRHQIDAAGAPINEIEQRVDWILGSGNHSRTYLYQTPWGELYQLPVAWYSQSGSWGMAPSFEPADHLGLGRLVQRECMFCHNAYPEAPAGSDAHHEPHRYPAELPEGIGCQRCHGPGAEHARAAMREPIDFVRVSETIVNPGNLPPRLRDDICFGCHMQPSVAIPGMRRLGRGDYSFRPGEPLPDYLIAVDVDEPGRDRGERFEINHHPYRLRQSHCFVESAGELTCLTCHDPHRKVPAAERAAHYRAACLGCHADDVCRLPEMGTAAGSSGIAADDCASCHMPRRRTQDVVRVVMTDHRIRRLPGGPELLAPLARREPAIEGLSPLEPERAPAGALGDLYRFYTVAEVTRGRHAEAVAGLERSLRRVRPAELEPYLALAKGQYAQGDAAGAQATLERLLASSPDYPQARELLGVVHERLGRRQEALAELFRVVNSDRDRPEARYNLSVLLADEGRFAEALPHLERALEMRPNMTPAWLYLGRVQAGMGRLAEAERSYRRAMAIEPRFDRAYLALGELLLAEDRRTEAVRILRHGAEHAAHPEAIASALAAATAAPGSRAPASSRR